MQAFHGLSLGRGLTAELAHPGHGPALIALVERNQPHIARYLPRAAKMLTPEHIDEHFADVQYQREHGSMFDWLLFQHGVLCGSLRLNHIEAENRKAAVAYFLDAAMQGQGLMTRALRGVIEHAFTRLDLHRIELLHARGNEASRRVAENVGFVQEGVLRQAEQADGEWVDTLSYGLLRHEWQAAAAARASGR